MSSNQLHSILSYLVVTGLWLGAATAADDDKLAARVKPVSLKLREDLLCDYDKTIRPVLAHTTTTAVDLIFLVKHVDFREYSSSLHVDSWMAMRWTDEHLQWSPQDYGNITTLILTTDDIWVPEISVYNKFAYDNSRVIDTRSQCVVRYEGFVICVPHTDMTGNCVPDLRHWPFDQQNCSLTIGSWTHLGHELNYNGTEVVIKGYMYRPNDEWTLKNVTERRDPGTYACCPNITYPRLHYSFLLQRHVGAIIAGVLIPILIFIIMSLMTLWLDPKAPERLYLVALNIPCHVMFLHNFVWTIAEPGDSVPYIVLLVRDSLLLVCLILVETLVVRWLLDTRSSTPAWLVSSFTVLVNSKPGQVLLFSELNPENAVANISAEDGDTLVEPQTERPKEWHLLGRAIDRAYFAVYILTYIIMMLVCVPK